VLGDPDPLVRRAALGALESLPPATRLGAAGLEDPVRDVRLEAARVLADLSRTHLPEDRARALAGALAQYRAAQELTADLPEARLNLGLLAVRTGDATAAEAAYRQALALDPGFLPGYVNLADLYRATARGRREAGAERGSGARAAQRRPAARHRPAAGAPAAPAGGGGRARAGPRPPPHDREILAGLAAFLAETGRREEALALAEKLTQLAPGVAEYAQLRRSLAPP
jgi:tetratricopeptide (TPR) repeat protein